MRYVHAMIMICLLVLACKSGDRAEDSRDMVKCPDGRMVPDNKLCQDIKPELSTEEEPAPGYKEVADTKKEITGETAAKEAFKNWASGKDYRFESAELVDIGGKEYYRVIYEHNEMSGGRRQVFVSMDGKVLEQVMVG